jgi:hypothetical protein
MPEDLARIIRDLPPDAFQEPSNRLEALTYLQRLHWLQQTAYFIWKYKGVARRRDLSGTDPGVSTD